MQTQSKTKEIALISLFAAINIISRVYMQALPNVKPVTSMIMLATLYMGVGFGFKVTTVTVLVSGVLLGLGLHIPFQLLAWYAVVLLTAVLSKIIGKDKVIPYACLSGVMGYVFGIVVSLEKLLTMGVVGYYTYWISGLYFDTLHAVGNVAFYCICAPVIAKIFTEQKGVIGYECKTRKSRVQSLPVGNYSRN